MMIYFAHPMSDYGSIWEARALIAITSHFKGGLINPNMLEHQRGFREHGMKHYDLNILPRIKQVVYAPFPDNTIGSGVGYELQLAYENDIPLFRIDRGTFKITTHVGRVPPYLTREKTREHIRSYAV